MSTSLWRHATGQRRTRPRPRQRGLAKGQSLVEFALVLPVLLLILLFAIDFGRAFFGYIIVNNAARLGANFAALNATADWSAPSDPAVVEFVRLIRSDTDVANCALASIPTPTFTDGTDAGTTATDVTDIASVGLTCVFRPLTPIIATVLGDAVNLSARADFPVRKGGVAGAVLPPPPPPPGLDCTAPSLVDQNENNAESLWGSPSPPGAGFSGPVTRVGNGNNWAIAAQSPPSGTTAACTSGVTIYRTVPGNLPPIASFTATPNSGAAPLLVAVDGSGSSDPDGTVVSYTWNFGDGNGGSGATASHTYALPGTYAITLGVTDNGGAIGVATHTVTVTGPANQPPVAAFTLSPSPVGVGQTVTADGSGSSDPDGSIVSWSWTFGDNGTSTGPMTTHAYQSPGTYAVTLTVTDNLGATGSTTRAIVVQCVVPNMNSLSKAAAKTAWTARGFTGNNFGFTGPGNGTVIPGSQTLAAGSAQPCATATVTVTLQ